MLFILFAGSVVGFWVVVCVGAFVIYLCIALMVFMLCLLIFVCVFSVFLFFSPLCSYVDQVLFGRIKIVSVTVFFLMKNMLRHGREKKSID